MLFVLSKIPASTGGRAPVQRTRSRITSFPSFGAETEIKTQRDKLHETTSLTEKRSLFKFDLL